MTRSRSFSGAYALVFLALLACSGRKEPAAREEASKAGGESESHARAPLRIAYSDWPGFVAWEIALQKNWFAEAGVPVEFSWFEYTPSLEAFAAGKVDAASMTNGDALVIGSGGAPSVSILLNDYSNGNDMIVVKDNLKQVADLKGKRVGVEVGFVSHLVLLKALEQAGLTESQLTIVNVPTDQTPQLLKSGSVDAIVAWQPSSGQALREVPGSTAIFTSRDVPGLIYDMLCVSPKSLAERRADWKKVLQVWFRVTDYMKDPANAEEVAKLMAARVGLAPEQYDPLIQGTHFLDLSGNEASFAKGTSLASVYFSSKTADDFQVKNGVYKKSVAYEQYFDPSLVRELASEASK